MPNIQPINHNKIEAEQIAVNASVAIRRGTPQKSYKIDTYFCHRQRIISPKQEGRNCIVPHLLFSSFCLSWAQTVATDRLLGRNPRQQRENASAKSTAGRQQKKIKLKDNGSAWLAREGGKKSNRISAGSDFLELNWSFRFQSLELERENGKNLLQSEAQIELPVRLTRQSAPTLKPRNLKQVHAETTGINPRKEGGQLRKISRRQIPPPSSPYRSR